MQGLPIRKHHAKEIIFREGDPGNEAYVLKAGTVEIWITVCGAKFFLQELTPPSVFGEMALLLKDSRRTATATALDDVESIEISKNVFESYIQKSPQVIRFLLIAFAERLRSMNIRASKAPDLFRAVSCMFDLLMAHGNTDLSYGVTVEYLAKSLLAAPREIEGILEMMSGFGLLEIKTWADGKKLIVLPGGDGFSRHAMKIHLGLTRGG